MPRSRRTPTRPELSVKYQGILPAISAPHKETENKSKPRTSSPIHADPVWLCAVGACVGTGLWPVQAERSSASVTVFETRL